MPAQNDQFVANVRAVCIQNELSRSMPRGLLDTSIAIDFVLAFDVYSPVVNRAI